MTTEHLETVGLLSRLIRNACVNDGTPDSGQEIRNARTLLDFFEGSGVRHEWVEPHPGRVSLIFRVPGTDPDAEPLTLLGHTDVVPADDREWERPPFSGDIRDGTVWGRGAVDMLNLTASMAVVTKRIAERGEPLAGDLVFAAVADEEAGSRFGVGWISRNREDLLPWGNALTESGGAHLPSKDRRTLTITVGEKGSAPRRIVARGVSGHGSMPYGSRNAAVIIADATLRLARHRGAPLLGGQWERFVRAHGFDAATEAALLNEDTLGSALGSFADAVRFAHAVTHLTISPNVLHAGGKANVIPGEGTLHLDIRVLPGQTEEDVDAELAAALGDLAPELTIERLGFWPPQLPSSEDSRLYRALSDAVRHQFPGADTVPVLTGGGTDARFIRQRGGNAYGFALFEPEWGIGKYRSLFHGANEHIDVTSLLRTVAALEHATLAFLAPGREGKILASAGSSAKNTKP
ncbi:MULTISPECIES: M20/M25/M40 family metallo-hydrolase [unclassified Pseudarthrobacter]|uniref:M20/M25/M40 family metallo-hydrolase n=1 Tax=unclassified Pseudarthrobacter TaxID=2647000 RepID=UPI00362F0A9F